MNTAALAASQAYAAQTKAVDPSAGAAVGSAGKEGFSDMLESALETVRETGQAADRGMVNQATGKADVVDVVTAVAEAELTVQTIVSVRDRMISAYQEILRMPI